MPCPRYPDRGAADRRRSAPPPDVLALQAVMRTHRAALDQWAAQALRTGEPPEDVLDGLEVDDTHPDCADLRQCVRRN
jgi:hypothetical protein